MNKKVILLFCLFLYANAFSIVYALPGKVSNLAYTSHHTTDTTQKAAPNSPSGLEVLDVSFDFIVIRWNDNSPSEDYFIIERRLEPEEFSRYDTVTANTTIYLDYRVEPNTTYYYRVSAVNPDGESGYSNEVSAATLNLPHAPPQKPSDLHGHFDGINCNIIGWKDNSYNELSFRIFRSTTREAFNLLDTVPANVTLFADYRIASEQTYYYYVTASNHYGMSEPSDTIEIEVGRITGIESPVLHVIQTTPNSVQIGWNAIFGNGIRYNVHRNEEGGTSAIVSRNLTHIVFTDTGLTDNTRYVYRIEAADSYSNRSYSNYAVAVTLPWYTIHRASDGLIAFYMFPQRINDSIPDLSWYKTPMNLHIADTTSLASGQRKALRIENGTLLSASPEKAKKIHEACLLTNEITIECWLKTTYPAGNEPVKIISFEDSVSTAFSIGCLADPHNENRISYPVNLRTITTDLWGNPKFTPEKVFETNVLQHIVFVHKRSGEDLFYLNGELLLSGFRPSRFDNWNESLTFLMANNITGNSPWLGDLYMLALYNRALSDQEINMNYTASPFDSDEYMLNPANYDLAIHPNPANDYISLLIENPHPYTDITEEYFIRIINLSGITVHEQFVSQHLEGAPFLIHLTGLNEGIYTLALYNRHSFILQQKLVIIR